MSAELRLKKLRGSAVVMAKVSDEQQMKGNLGGPDLFLAPIGRLDSENISKHFCNTCEKEFEGSPKIEFENPNEEVAENLVLLEKDNTFVNHVMEQLQNIENSKNKMKQVKLECKTIRSFVQIQHS